MMSIAFDLIWGEWHTPTMAGISYCYSLAQTWCETTLRRLSPAHLCCNVAVELDLLHQTVLLSQSHACSR